MLRAVTIFLIILFAILAGYFPANPRARVIGSQQPQDLNKSSSSTQPLRGPLLEAIYQASRAENSKDSLRYLDQSRDLLAQGADVKTKDADGRTPLHWAVIGGIYAREEKHIQTYLELVELLISKGAEVNAQDQYGNTPLDFQEVSPNDEILYLLLDQGASNGPGKDETRRLNNFINNLSTAFASGDFATVRREIASDLPAGTELQIRLTSNVGSQISRSGDQVEAVVIAPVMVGQRVVIGPGTRVRGTVLLAMKAYNDSERPQLILDFPYLLTRSNSRSWLATRVAGVDNAKETVQGGRIIGLPHPNSTKFSWGVRLFGLAAPLLSSAVEAGVLVHDKEYKREIVYPPGVEMMLSVLAPTKLTEVGGQDWASLSTSPALIELARAQPLQTTTPKSVPSDLTNLMIIGTQEKIDAAFKAAGWDEPEKLGLRSGMKTFIAIAENKGYTSAPVSLLLLDGRGPDLAFQKQNNTFAKRHHIRLWKSPQRYQEQDVWVAAATHDIGIAMHGKGTHWIHLIDSKIDRERSKVVNDLLFTGLCQGYVLIDRPAAPRESMNATGDKLETDGRIAVLVLK
jgi:LssY C-terminus/Ankyrin repeat